MNIGSICRRHVVTIGRGESLVRAATLMREQHVGSLVVTDHTPEGPYVVGVVTDRDLVIEALARGFDRAGVAVGDLANTHAASVREDDDRGQAIARMLENGVRRLLVTDAEKRVVGFVSMDDLIEAYAGELDALAKVIRSGVKRETQAVQAMVPTAPVLLRFPGNGAAGAQK